MKRPDVTRDAVMFVVGVGAFLYILISGDTRAPILYASLALMGVASALRGFSVVRKNGGS